MAKRMYYNPFEVPRKIRFISSKQKSDVIIDTTEDCGEYPLWIPDLFKALKKGQYDEIVITVSEHCQCYYYTKQGLRERLIGEIALSQYSDGSGYLQDIKFMTNQER